MSSASTPSPAPAAGPSLLQLSPQDNCAIALRNLRAGEAYALGEQVLCMQDDVAFGHKVALTSLVVGDKILRWGAVIGSATQAIEPGQHIHVHNLRSDYLPTYTLAAGQGYVGDQSVNHP